MTLTDLDGNGEQTMRFAGYLDCLKSGLPDLNNTAIGIDIRIVPRRGGGLSEAGADRADL